MAVLVEDTRGAVLTLLRDEVLDGVVALVGQPEPEEEARELVEDRDRVEVREEVEALDPAPVEETPELCERPIDPSDPLEEADE